MRYILLSCLLFSISSVCVAQRDTTGFKRSRAEKAPQREVMIPGVNSPTSSPGTLLQSSPDPNVLPADQQGRKTSPPSDPRAFGVAIPLGKSKKDTLRKD